jgi:alpha-galactosidase
VCLTQASKVGINLIVLDDGWFGKRESDAGSLGDWVADLRKFPQGIKGLAEDVNAAGCKLGLWFEPEMVSDDSVCALIHCLPVLLLGESFVPCFAKSASF